MWGSTGRVEQAFWVEYEVGGSTFQIKGFFSKGPFVLERVMWSWCQGVVFFETVVSTARSCILDGALVKSKERIPKATAWWAVTILQLSNLGTGRCSTDAARLHLAPGQS